MGKGEPRKCNATSKRSGKGCVRAPIKGGTVCYNHGGAAPQVRRKADERLLDMIDPDRALREAARMAYASLGDFYGPDGNLRPKSEWSPGMWAAVRKLETVKVDVTPGQTGPAQAVHRLELWEKPKALEMLFKHLGLLVERMEHSGKVEFQWQK